MGVARGLDGLSEKVSWRAASRFVGPGCISAAALAMGGTAVLLVVAGLGLALGDFVTTEVAGTQRRKEWVRVRVEDLLEVARDMLWASGSKNVRVNVMLVRDGKLWVEYRRGNYAPEETTEPWARGQGCAGQAYERDRIVFGALDDRTRDAARAMLGSVDAEVEVLLPQRIEAERIASVMSVPVCDRTRNIVAVLNVDDRLSLTDSALVKREVVQAFERIANRLAAVLDDAP